PLNANIEQPKKSNVFVTVLAGLFLIGVIIFGAMQIRPVFEDARERNRFQEAQATREKKAAQAESGAQTESQPVTKAETKPETKNEATSEPVAKTEDTAKSENHDVKVSEKKPLETTAAPAALKPLEPGLNAAAARFKARIEESAAPSGLSRKLRIH